MPKQRNTPKALKPKPILELIPLKPGVGEEPTQLPILLRIQVPQPETQNEHPPLNLALVLDTPGREGAYPLPPLLAGRRLEYLLELTTPGGAASVEVRLHYHRPEGGEEVQEARLVIPALPLEALSALPPHPAVKAMMARVRATQLRKAAMEALWEGDLATFQRLIDGALAEAEEEELEELEKLGEEGLRSPNRARKFLSYQYFTSSRGEA